MSRTSIISAIAFASCVAVITLSARGGDRRRSRHAQVAGPAAPAATQTKGGAAIDPQAQADAILADKIRPRGTSLAPHPKAKGRVRDVMAEIGRQAALGGLPTPEERIGYFAHLTKDHRITGWYGVIDDVVGDGDRLMFKVRISPHISSPSATVVSTSDYRVETYEISGGEFHYLGGEAAPPGHLNFTTAD